MLGLVTEYLQCDTCISGKNTPETLKYLWVVDFEWNYFYVFSKCIQRVYLTFIIIKQVNMYLYVVST